MRQFPWPHPIIAREGWPFLGIAVIAAMFADAWLGSFFSGLLWVAAIGVVARAFSSIDLGASGCGAQGAVCGPCLFDCLGRFNLFRQRHLYCRR